MYIYVTGGWNNKNKDRRHTQINTSVKRQVRQPVAGQSSDSGS